MNIQGELTFQGDKSLSHRAAIFAAMAAGNSTIHNFLRGEDTMNTLRAMEQLGATVTDNGTTMEVQSPGITNWRKPDQVLDMGNSGTGSRLLLGLLSGLSGITATIDGDDSLRKRPMKRVTVPLRSVGAVFSDSETLPIDVTGQQLQPISFTEKLGSAQVKSAMILAALSSGVACEIEEPITSRDHTENMLAFTGIDIRREGNTISLKPPYNFKSAEYHIWGDISSAAFFIVAALLSDSGSLVIRNVLLNPYRDRYIDVLKKMGGRIEVLPQKNQVGEKGGDIVVYPSRLTGIRIPDDWIPGVIDELPILTIAGAFAEGEFSYRSAKELRVKESDRISAMADNLKNLGMDVTEYDDGLSIKGNPAAIFRGDVESHMDHRIAMSFEIAHLKSLSNAGRTAKEYKSESPLLRIHGKEWIGTSFPDFYSKLDSILQPPATGGKKKITVTFDGPAGSGKSTLAKEIARRHSLYQIDSGALYRAYTWLFISTVGPAFLQQQDWDKAPEAKEILQKNSFAILFETQKQRILHNGNILEADIRSREITAHIKEIADSPEIRNRVNEIIRNAAKSVSIVADGRDMGTVVFPNADRKFFITASIDERARRRIEQLGEKAADTSLETIRQEIEWRDKDDESRKFGALKAARDAIWIDTTTRNQKAVSEIIESYLQPFLE